MFKTMGTRKLAWFVLALAVVMGGTAMAAPDLISAWPPRGDCPPVC